MSWCEGNKRWAGGLTQVLTQVLTDLEAHVWVQLFEFLSHAVRLDSGQLGHNELLTPFKRVKRRLKGGFSGAEWRGYLALAGSDLDEPTRLAASALHAAKKSRFKRLQRNSPKVSSLMACVPGGGAGRVPRSPHPRALLRSFLHHPAQSLGVSVGPSVGPIVGPGASLS